MTLWSYRKEDGSWFHKGCGNSRTTAFPCLRPRAGQGSNCCSPRTCFRMKHGADKARGALGALSALPATCGVRLACWTGARNFLARAQSVGTIESSATETQSSSSDVGSIFYSMTVLGSNVICFLIFHVFQLNNSNSPLRAIAGKYRKTSHQARANAVYCKRLSAEIAWS